MKHDILVDTRIDKLQGNVSILYCKKCNTEFGEWKNNKQLIYLRENECVGKRSLPSSNMN